jgi:hypothetical protein
MIISLSLSNDQSLLSRFSTSLKQRSFSMSYTCVLVYDEDSPETIWEEDFNCFVEAREYLLANKERNLVGIELNDSGDVSGNILSLHQNSGDVWFHPDHLIVAKILEQEAEWRKRMGLPSRNKL